MSVVELFIRQEELLLDVLAEPVELVIEVANVYLVSGILFVCYLGADICLTFEVDRFRGIRNGLQLL